LKDAVAACGSGRVSPRLRAPATAEALLDAIDSVKSEPAVRPLAEVRA